jgi:RNA 2',3'-cyclic 3'-phosphodiesterase
VLRLFIALFLPATIRHRLAGVQRALAATGIPYRWAHADGLHLTLLFLGPRDVADVPTIEAAMRLALAERRPLQLAVTALGGFPSPSRSRTLWAGVDGDRTALDALQRALQREVRAAGIAFEPQAFRPHITLGRAKRQSATIDLAHLSPEAAPPAAETGPTAKTFGAWTATTVELVRSELRPGGSVYTTMYRAPLSGVQAAPGGRPAPPVGGTPTGSTEEAQ